MRAVVVDELAEHAGRAQPGQPGQVDGRLGVPGPAQHPALAGAQRHHVPRPGEVAGTVDGSASSRIVCARSAAEMPVATPSRASTETVYAVPRRSWLVWYIGGSSSRSQSASVSGTQMKPGRVADHERHQLRRRQLGGEDQVALVLAVLVVDHDDRPARRDVRDRPLDGRESHDRLATSFSTYLAITSTSRLTGSPTPLCPSVVSLRVVGIRPTSKYAGRPR